MKSFLLRILVFSLPIVALGMFYLVEDPFKVIHEYSNYRPFGQALTVPLNQGMVSTSVFKQNQGSAHYNAFIFGSSRSMFYQASDWKRHLPSDARVFHFDASSETIEGIAHKLDYVVKSGCKVHHALVVIDGNTFESKQLFNEHLFMEDPRLVRYRNLVEFQSAHWMAFLDRGFFKAYADYRITGQAKPYMSAKGVLDNRPFVYDSISNELRYEYFEALIASGEYYTEDRMKPFYKRDGKFRFASPVITAESEVLLTAMAKQFSSMQTEYFIVISPLYNQIKMNASDVIKLKQIFGEQRVYDFSGVNRFTKDYSHYYERSHYRPFVAAMVLDSIYGR
jgi:hypothetical protein